MKLFMSMLNKILTFFVLSYLINFSNKSVNWSFETIINIAAILRNGPKGIIFSLSENKMIKATGKAMKVAKNIVQIDIGNPNTIPNKNINFISPPPRDSF